MNVMTHWFSRKAMAIGLFAFTTTAISFAEIRQTVQIDLQNTLATGGGEALSLATGTGQLKLQSSGNRNVKGYLGLQADINLESSIALDRAYIKTRYDTFTINAGKTRLSWGEGAVFNAADVVMGGSDLALDLAADEFRSNSRWLVSVSKSHGRFSFTELVMLPPDQDPLEPISSANISKAKVAIRTQFQLAALAKTKVEMGYALADDNHQPYVSLQSGHGINWHLSASLQPDKSINTSSGLYGVKDVGEQSTLNYRTELLVRSSGETSEQPGADNYVAYGYLEIGLSTGGRVSYFNRNLISPVDQSALVLLGSNINLHQGLNLFGNASLQFGDENDAFSSQNIGAQSYTLGLSFVY